MLGIANENGSNDHLVRINKQTGATTDLGFVRTPSSTKVEDVEGLTFAPSGALLATTGEDSTNGFQDSLFDIDPVTAVATNRRPLGFSTMSSVTRRG